MKKYFLLSVIVTGLLFSCSNSKSKIKDPEDIGKYVFELLKKINKTTKVEYLDKFIAPIEIIEIYAGGDIDSIKNVIIEEERMDLVEWEEGLTEALEKIRNKRNKIIEKDFNYLKGDAGKLGIVWEEIKYLDYTYEIKTENYIYGERLSDKKVPKICVSKLYLKYKDIPFYVEIESLYVNNNYELYEIRGLYH